jgi:MFS family permease
LVLGLTSLFTDVGTEMIFPLLPVFIASLGGGAAFLGLIEGIADATASLLKLGSGLWADRLPRKKPLVVAGYALASLVRPFVAVAHAPWHVLVVRVSDRVGKGVRSAPRDVLIANAAPAGQAGRAFGFHQAMDHAGAVLGPLIATGLLGLGWSLRSVFWAAIVPGLLATLCVSVVREARVSGASESSENVAAAPALATQSETPSTLPARLKHYFAILLLFSLGNSTDAFLLLRAHDVGVSVVAMPILWTAFHVVKLVTNYFGGQLADRVPRVALVIAGWSVYALAYLGFGLAKSALHVCAAFLVYGLFFGLTEPTEKAIVKDLAPLALRGKAYGYYNFVLGISAIPASLLTGAVWQRFGALAAFGTGAALAGAAAIWIAAWALAGPRLA